MVHRLYRKENEGCKENPSFRFSVKKKKLFLFMSQFCIQKILRNPLKAVSIKKKGTNNLYMSSIWKNQ